ncbi:MAG: GcrA family cell cycle regulator [Kiloniellales bacterium]
MTWSEDRIRELRRLWQAGYSASAIGKALGVSKNAVVGKAHRLKLTARPSPIRAGGAPRRRSVVPAVVAARPEKPAAVAPPAAAPQPAREQRPKVAAQNGKGPACLWPIGDPGDADFHFCSQPSAPGKPYCQDHCAKAYINKNRQDSQAA